jgi:glutaminyl-tRNA synthetase
VRLYENIIDETKGVYNEDGSLNLNPNSLTEVMAQLEPALAATAGAEAEATASFQFVRQGFFHVDPKSSGKDALVFNRIVSLKSSFKIPGK